MGCPISCGPHGQCVSGACQCQCGWTGTNCSLASGMPAPIKSQFFTVEAVVLTNSSAFVNWKAWTAALPCKPFGDCDQQLLPFREPAAL